MSNKCVKIILEECHKKEVEIVEEITMLNIIDKLNWLIVRNRSYEAKKLVKQEIENLKEITEKNCKSFKINKTYCKVCKNSNCNINQNNATKKEV